MATEAAEAPPIPATAAAPAADNASQSQPAQVDLADQPLENLDKLFESGNLDITPEMASGGGGKVGSPAPAQPETPAAPAPEPPATPETPAEPETPAAPEAQVETPATPETPEVPVAPETPTTPETPAAQVETPVTPEPEIEGIQRPRLKDPVDQQIAAVFKAAETSGQKITWSEAERRVKGDPATPVAPTPTVTDSVETLRSEILELETQLEEKSGEEGVLYDKAVKDLTTHLADKKMDLKLAERDLAQQETRTRESRKETRRTAQAKAVTKFPSVADGESPLGKAVAARIAALKTADSPVLYDDNAPWLIALECATELGIAPVQPAPATPPSPPLTPKPAAPPRKVVSPPSGAKTAAPATPVNPQAEKAKTVEYLKKDAPLEELDNLFMPEGQNALLFAVGGR